MVDRQTNRKSPVGITKKIGDLVAIMEENEEIGRGLGWLAMRRWQIT
jgi:hypothetical protein